MWINITDASGEKRMVNLDNVTYITYEQSRDISSISFINNTIMLPIKGNILSQVRRILPTNETALINIGE